jgi:hypothetical protein
MCSQGIFVFLCYWCPSEHKKQGANPIAPHFGIHESNVFILHFFVLIQRNEAKKNQGKPDRSARFA